jgi:hypothetical protein
MPETLEALLWCAALATWLMVLFYFMGAGLSALWKSRRRLFLDAMRSRPKRN